MVLKRKNIEAARKNLVNRVLDDYAKKEKEAKTEQEKQKIREARSRMLSLYNKHSDIVANQSETEKYTNRLKRRSGVRK